LCLSKEFFDVFVGSLRPPGDFAHVYETLCVVYVVDDTIGSCTHAIDVTYEFSAPARPRVLS
jgi:hypothetical protein